MPSDNRADFRKKIAAAPKDVRRKYHLWRRKIRRAYRKHLWGKRTEVVLYQSSRIYDTKVVLPYISKLVGLLTHPAQGWIIKKDFVRVKHGFRTRVILMVE